MHSDHADSASKPGADWYFDFISPFAYMQLQQLGPLRARLQLQPRPILLAAVLDHNGQKGPAEIVAKRRYTYRFVQWQAHRLGLPLRFPPAHPFNPLLSLRLAIAGACSWDLIAAIYEHIWVQGRPADQPDHLAELAARFGIADVAAACAAPEVKAQLRAHTEHALAAGVFGVPTVAVAGELFWGLDATPMLIDFLDGDAVFADPQMLRIDSIPAAAERRPG
jgi:2-hydroxychromene-2-carboxylate isomerase